MMHVYVYFYFGVISCIYKCFCLFMFYIYVFTRVLCVYILIACSSKNLCDIAQLDVGYVTECSAERTKVFSSIAWPDMGGWGHYTLSQIPLIFLVMPFQTNLRKKILTLQCDNDWYKEVKDFIRQNTMMVPIFEVFTLDDDGLLIFKNRSYVPPNDELRSLILNEDHRAVYMAHPRVTKMRAELKPLFFWKG
jgi:hypothetical protein